MEKETQPKKYDLVLGGNNSPPTDGLVLGGIEGVKKRLNSDDVEVRITALKEAIKYGDRGLDLVVNALEDKAEQVQIAAYKILCDRDRDFKIQQAIINFNPYRFFESVLTIDTSNNDPGFLTFNPDGNKLLYCASNSFFVTGESIIRYLEWNLKSTEPLEIELLKRQFFISNISNTIASLYIHPQTKTLIAAGTAKDDFHCSQIEVIDLTTGISKEELDNIDGNSSINRIIPKQIIQTLYGHTNGGIARINAALSSDRTILATSSQRSQKWTQEDNSVILWDVKTGNKLHILKGHTNKVTSLAISNCDRVLATASEDGTIQEWDIKTGDNIYCNSRDRNIVTNNIFNCANGLIQLKADNPSDIFSINSDAKIIVSARYERHPQDISQIDISLVGQDRHLATLHHNKVASVAISPDGNTIASLGVDTTTTHGNNITLHTNKSNIKIWQVK